MGSSIQPMHVPVDLTKQSIESPNSGGTRQSRLVPTGEVTGLIYDDAKTFVEAMQRGHRFSNNGRCLGWRDSDGKYKWLSYADVIRRAKDFASGLIKIGMEPGQSSFVGIYCRNCVEWVLTEYACYNQSAIPVPLYDTLGPTACTFIINQAEIQIVVCGTVTQLESLLEQKSSMPNLKHLITIFEPNAEIKKSASDKGVFLHLFQDVEVFGKKNPVPAVLPNSEDIATVCYTSGTTGNPKGAVISHGNMVSCACAFQLQLGDYGITKNDVHISYLPLAHIMERFFQALLFLHGGSIGFFGGNVNSVMEDMQALKPTIFVAVPRVLNKIHDKVQASTNTSVIKRYLLEQALRAKQAEIEKLIVRNDGIWDQLVLKKIQKSFGGNLRIVMTGAAPCADHILNFFRCALGCIVLQGYGQTECAAPCATGVPGDYSVGNVGAPLPCNYIKLIDVPDMEYFSSKGQGEICVKGTNVFKYYLKNPEKTAETLDEDGWLHTGDIGMWLQNGTLKIIDRKKHIFKLSQGEYVAPEKVENIYLTSKYVSQIFVHGESLQSYTVAVVIPDKDILMPWCKENDIRGEWKEICGNEKVKNFICKDLHRLGEAAGLKSFEQVKVIHLHPNILTAEDSLFTPTLKLKRELCLKYFKSVIEDMYKCKI